MGTARILSPNENVCSPAWTTNRGSRRRSDRADLIANSAAFQTWRALTKQDKGAVGFRLWLGGDYSIIKLKNIPFTNFSKSSFSCLTT